MNPSKRAALSVGEVIDSTRQLIERYGFNCVQVPPAQPIPGSYWGEPEAGVIGSTLFVRDDTPAHSLLHEFSHLLCMDDERRAGLHTDAGGDDLEESAVCYLQILLAEALYGSGDAAREQLFSDMDEWGYSFRLGSTEAWFRHDAAEARAWLIEFGLIDPTGRVTGQLRTSGMITSPPA